MRKDFFPALESAMGHALEYLRSVDDRPVGPRLRSRRYGSDCAKSGITIRCRPNPSSNWQTSHEDVTKTVAGVERVLAGMRGSQRLGKKPSRA